MSYEQEQQTFEQSRMKWLGPRSADTEARVRPVLDKVFETSPGVTAPYRLTCDIDDCLLIVDTRVVDPRWWMPRFQDQVPRAGLESSLMIGADNAFFGVPAAGVSAGFKWMRDVDEAFDNSPALADCMHRFPDAGRIKFTVHPDLTSRSAPFTVSGSLATAPIAACAADVAAAALRNNPMPNVMTYAFKAFDLSVRVR